MILTDDLCSGVAGSGLEGFPKQWWKILQTKVSEIAILTTFQLQTTRKSSSVLMNFYIKTW